MLNDKSRNESFINALKSILNRRKGNLAVLDLGSGTGILGNLNFKLNQITYYTKSFNKIEKNEFREYLIEKKVL
jgi:hypothetical protein